MGHFCLGMDALYVVNTTENRVEHNLFGVYKQGVGVSVATRASLVSDFFFK